MSLIEKALEKLQRSGEADAERKVRLPRNAIAAAAPAKAASAVAVPALNESISARRMTIDRTRLRAAGYLPEEGLERRFAEYYRRIKRPLIDKALAGSADMRLIMITSALPGDGKTFNSLNLVFSMAQERDVSVLLIDADFARAKISEVLGIRGEPGMVDALRDESLDVETLIQRTDVHGLDILPAGRFVENATELLASTRMAQLAGRMGARNPRRLLVFDSAPLLVSNEARVLARLPGQVVIVVRAGATPRQALLDVVGYIDKAKLQGVILNDTPFDSSASYYDYSAYGLASNDAPGTG